jgi:D-glycero-D-manno-heptose 1,7-bisphosphate phosphatase
MSLPLQNSPTVGSAPLQAVFLDRDGVINRDSPAYIKSWAEFEFLPGSRRAIARLTRAGILVIVVTNQSAVGRGMLSRKALEEMLTAMASEIEAAGGHLRDVLYCPHRPDDGCACRKPRAGMIREAVRRHGLDVSACAMVGDSAKDIECALAAGCKWTILVQTGNGPAALGQLAHKGIRPRLVAADLAEAVEQLLSIMRNQPDSFT